MNIKKKPKVFRVQHNPEIEMREQEGMEQATPSEERNPVDLFLAELIRVHEGMPDDLIKTFWNVNMKVASIEGLESATYYINNTLVRTEKGLEYIVKELDAFLGQNRRRHAEHTQGVNQGDQGEEENDETPMDDRGLEQVPDFSEGEVEGDLEQYIRTSIQKSVDYLNQLLARIKKLELRVDTHDTDIAALRKDVKELKDFNDALPDFLATKVQQVLADNQGSSTIPGQTFVVRNLEGTQIGAVEGIFPKEWNTILELASARKNILLVGPSGCGKTHASEMLAKAYNLPYSSISCSEGMSEGDIKGWLLPVGEGGKFEYVPSDFVEAYENGGVFCADELDAADANFGTFLNKAIGNKSFHLAIRRGNTLVKKHKDFVFIACANTFGNGSDFVYVGRNQLDGATLDRFRCGIVTMDYDPEVEKMLIDPEVLTWGTFIRKAILETRQTKRMMTTRFMIDISHLKQMYNWGPTEWEKHFFSDWGKDDCKRVFAHVKSQVEARIGAIRGGR